jgi:PAS domain S-box-containing protein
MNHNPEPGIELDLDLSGHILAASPSVERAIGYHVEELVGQPFDSLIPYADLPALRARWQSALQGDAGDHEIHLLGKYGDIRTMRVCCRPLHRDGRTIGLHESMIDVTPSEN